MQQADERAMISERIVSGMPPRVLGAAIYAISEWVRRRAPSSPLAPA